MNKEMLVLAKGYVIDLPPHGYVRYIDHLGTDQRIVEAARVSYGSPSKGEEADKKLLMYLYRNRHTSPFEQCNITFNIKMPIFCMRQFVRHRTFRLNEFSGRYSEMPDEFFYPPVWRKQDTKNKQGSIQEIDSEWQGMVYHTAKEAYDFVYKLYKVLINVYGVAKEQARMILPVGIYTEIYVNCDLHNLMHFLRLRLDAHAQSEIQDIAVAMKLIAKELFPWTFEAFERYSVRVIDRADQKD